MTTENSYCGNIRDTVMNGKCGKLNLFPVNESVLGTDAYRKIKNNKIYDLWQKSRLDISKLQFVLDKICTADFMNNYCECMPPLQWVEHTADKLQYVESDVIFKADCFYVPTFAQYLCEYEELPNEHQYWKYWLEQNDKAMEYNLTDVWAEGMQYKKPRSAVAWLMFKETSRIAMTPNISEKEFLEQCDAISRDKYIKMVKNAAALRCKRFLASAIRELHILANIISRMPDSILYWHPIVDILYKTDVIMGIPDKNRLVSLAIYLDSNDARAKAMNKFPQMDIHFKNQFDLILSVPVKYGFSHSNKVHLIDDDGFENIERILNLETKGLRKEKPNGVYFELNSQKEQL